MNAPTEAERLFRHKVVTRRERYLCEHGVRSVISSRHNDLAVNKMDKIAEELPVIHHHLATKIQHCTAHPSRTEVVRLPLQAYLFCKQIFKRQVEVERYLLDLLLADFYLRDVQQAITEPTQSPEALSPYLRMLLASNDTVTVYLAQLFLRFCVLGLAVRTGQQRREAVCHKTKALVRELQVELVLAGGVSFAELMVVELEVLAQEFACLEFYEGLREVFAKCDTYGVQEWIEKALEDRRKQFDQRLNVPLEKKREGRETQRKVIKQKRVTISVNDLEKENPIPSTQTATAEQKTGRPPSVSAFAEKMRLSGGPTAKSLPKLPHRFIYVSNRKAASQEETAPEAYAQFEESSYHSPTKQEASQQEVQEKHRENEQFEVGVVMQASPQDSKVLCQQTPPRAIRWRYQ